MPDPYSVRIEPYRYELPDAVPSSSPMVTSIAVISVSGPVGRIVFWLFSTGNSRAGFLLIGKPAKRNTLHG